MNKIMQTRRKKTLSYLLAVMMSFSIFGGFLSTTNVKAATSNTGKITFKIQSGGTYDGMPVFDGVPEHMNAYIDALFTYTGLEGPAVYATGNRDVYTLVNPPDAKNKGKKIPGALSAADNVQGVSTDFPSMLAMGQSWNKDLLHKIGDVMGEEKVYTLSSQQGVANTHSATAVPGTSTSPTVAFTAVTDMRVNPLNGRFDENFGEDQYLVGTMADKLATGLSGIDKPASNNGFWQRAVVGTKHYGVYTAEWYREKGSNSASARSILEYQIQGAEKGLNSGSISGVMNSFGRTNGIPNIINPYQFYTSKNSKYGVYSSPDFGADSNLTGDAPFPGSPKSKIFSNEYDDNYAVDRTHATVLQVLSTSNAGRPMGSNAADVTDLVAAVNNGMYGITAKDLIEAAKPHLIALIRTGIFNEGAVDAKGRYLEQNYPFSSFTRENAAAVSNYKVAAHQEVEKAAARESIVLLKNNGKTLPLNKDAKLNISGIYANARFRTQYSTSSTPSAKEVTDAGFTPLQGILDTVTNKDNVTYQSGNAVVGIQAVGSKKFMTAPASGGVVAGNYDNAKTLTPEQLFNVYDWSQNGYSLQAQSNGKWLKYATTSPEPFPFGSTKMDAAVSNTDTTKLAVDTNNWDHVSEMFGSTTSTPPLFRIVNNSDGTKALTTFATSMGGFPTDLYASNLIHVDQTGQFVPSAKAIGNAETLAKLDDCQKFNIKTVKDTAADAGQWASGDSKYAVVFVGANVKHVASEGKDRETLRMGESDYKLAHKVAAEFHKAGKKTVVVVETNFPVIMDELQNDANIDAIVYQPYGGQYDGKALAEVLFGDVCPTGRLTSTWYKSMDALPNISKYSLPEGSSMKLSDIDPAFTKDMTNADPIEAKLTYQYTNAGVTYPFGYGLSYSSFKYSGFSAPKQNDGKTPFTVSVDVKNTGSKETSEVVQLYISNNASAYGDAAPKKKLVAFDKVDIAPGKTKKVALTVNPDDFRIWDVNRGEFIVESGNYDLMVGSSSSQTAYSAKVTVAGKAVGDLDPESSFNVFDHSYDTSNVVYNEVSKVNTAEGLKEGRLVGGYYSVTSKGSQAYAAIPNVILMDNLTSITSKVASNAGGGTISLCVDSPTAAPFATITVPASKATTSVVDGLENGAKATELAYVEANAKINGSITGKHTIYVVFNAADLRIDSLKFNKTAK